MRPTDFFLSFRHFFGYLVPGSLWVTGFMLAIRHHPGELGDWFAIGGFLIGSYVIGYSVHGPMFILVTRINDHLYQCDVTRDHWRRSAHRAVVRAILDRKEKSGRQAALASTGSDRKLEEFCKRYVIEYSAHLRDELIDYEGTVNFVAGMIPALIVLAVGLEIHFLREADVPGALLGYFASSFLAVWLMAFRLYNKRSAERDLWLKAFLILAARPEGR